MTATKHADYEGSPFTAALYYASLGWRVLPIRPGSKHPPMGSWQHAATTNPGVITNWYQGLYRNHGVGILTGPTSGIWVLDVDVSDGKRGDETLAELESIHGPLPPTVRAITGSGGSHIFFKDPGGVPIRNSASTRLGPGLDIRGNGGVVVAAPTIHPNGHPYAWEIDHGPDEITTADTPQWLLELAADPQPAAKIERTGLKIGDTDSIAARINADHRWHDVLYADGWQLHHTDHTNHDTHWTRPGKNVRDGSSAVLHHPDGPFTVFTTAVQALQQPWAAVNGGTGWTYSLFGYVAATRHHGDRSECARTYRHAANAQIVTMDSTRHAHQALTDEANSDWDPTDLATISALIRTGNYQPTTPEILHVDKSIPLLYPGRINSLFGESGGGKTWVALAAIAETTRNGQRALLIDYEDAPAGIAERLVALGLSDNEIALIDYVNPTTGLSELSVAEITKRTHTYRLIVIDSTGEAMAAGGVDPNADAEVARWFVLIRQLTRLDGGPAVLILDHVPKAADAPSAYAIGSQRKRAAVSGAAYRIDTLREPAKGRDGKLRLTVAKDRPGNRAKSTTAAIVDIISDGDTVELMIHLSDAQAAAAEGRRFRPTVLMERISRWLEINPGASTRQIFASVTGKRETLQEALEVLTAEGWVAAEAGERGGKSYRSQRSFRELDDTGTDVGNPVDNHGSAHRSPTAAPPRPTAAHRGPTAARPRSESPDDRGPVVPPPFGGTRGRGRTATPENTPTAAPNPENTPKPPTAAPPHTRKSSNAPPHSTPAC